MVGYANAAETDANRLTVASRASTMWDVGFLLGLGQADISTAAGQTIVVGRRGNDRGGIG